jgi:hypothetical protein
VILVIEFHVLSVIATLHKNWTITTTFDPREDFGRGSWSCTVSELGGDESYVVVRVVDKRPVNATLFAIEEAIAKAGGAAFF